MLLEAFFPSAVWDQKIKTLYVQAERVRVLLLDDEDDEDEEEVHQEDRENLTCAVCLDVYFSPHRSQACGHIFCEPCLRAHAMNCGMDKTTCPLCRDVILYTNLQTGMLISWIFLIRIANIFFKHVLYLSPVLLSSSELDQRAKTLFPKLYKARKREFEASPCASWPLPEGEKLCCLVSFVSI